MDPNQSKKLDQKRALARVENEFRENGSYDMLVKQCGDKLLNDEKLMEDLKASLMDYVMSTSDPNPQLPEAEKVKSTKIISKRLWELLNAADYSEMFQQELNKAVPPPKLTVQEEVKDGEPHLGQEGRKS